MLGSSSVGNSNKTLPDEVQGDYLISGVLVKNYTGLGASLSWKMFTGLIWCQLYWRLSEESKWNLEFLEQD